MRQLRSAAQPPSSGEPMALKVNDLEECLGSQICTSVNIASRLTARQIVPVFVPAFSVTLPDLRQSSGILTRFASPLPRSRTQTRHAELFDSFLPPEELIRRQRVELAGVV
jgi:hypothetical protein